MRPTLQKNKQAHENSLPWFPSMKKILKVKTTKWHGGYWRNGKNRSLPYLAIKTPLPKGVSRYFKRLSHNPGQDHRIVHGHFLQEDCGEELAQPCWTFIRKIAPIYNEVPPSSLCFFLFQCEKEDGPITERLLINAYKVPCTGFIPQECYLVKQEKIFPTENGPIFIRPLKV